MLLFSPCFLCPSVRELAYHRASHWSGWIAGDSSSELWPSEEDPLTHSGSPSNRIDNSGTAAPTSPRANKFTIQTWTKVLKRNVRNTLICFYKRFDRSYTRKPLQWCSWKEYKLLFSRFYFLLVWWFSFMSIVFMECWYNICQVQKWV